jgi:hypothetical protein
VTGARSRKASFVAMKDIPHTTTAKMSSIYADRIFLGIEFGLYCLK